MATTAINSVSMYPASGKNEDVPAAREERQDLYMERTYDRGGMFQRTAANRHIIAQSPQLARRGPAATVTLGSCNVLRRWRDTEFRCQKGVMNGNGGPGAAGCGSQRY